MNLVFISYSQESPEHARAVRLLGERLRVAKIPVELDQFYRDEHPGGPDEGWPKWCEDRANKATCVLVVPSSGWFDAYNGTGQIHSGHGAAAEARLFRQFVYDEKGRNERIRLAFVDSLPPGSVVPEGLRAWHQFRPLTSDAELDQLIKWLAERLGLGEVESPTVRSPEPLADLKPDIANRNVAERPAGSQGFVEKEKAPLAKDILESPHPTTLRLFLGLSWLYWILTGPWPLLWLFINPGPNCHDWWSTVTSSPHLYFHSTFLGLFLTLCLRYPLGAMFTSSVFSKRMWITLPGLLALTLLFILYDVKEGPELYGCDPTGFWLPLSSALQMLAFTLTAAVAILISLRTVTDPSPHIADRKVSNRLFGTILYGLLWLPMRSAYEEASPQARGLLHSDSFWLVVFIFILVEALLVFSVLYKQRRYIAPIFVMVVSILVLSVALMYPNMCKHLFGGGGTLYIYLFLFGLGLVGYLGMIPDESKNKA